ncbi:MAG: restriction endonuclease subunit S, partial [Proteobacteria bacterium]|nr:restriction endonuclease subunit S [Pseudomonadota bacterium]
ELVGKCALVPALNHAYAYASFLIRITPSNLVLPKYLETYLNSSNARSQMFSKAKSSAGINNINTRELGSITINLPTLDEQIRIVDIIRKLIKTEQRARDLAESVLTQIDVMKKAILARAFRGELGTNDPSEAACKL